MAIEVVCTQCNAKLQVPDEAAGAQAKCPHCEAVFEIDAAGAPADGMAPPHVPDSSAPPVPPPADLGATTPYGDPNLHFDSPSDPQNPYAAPSSAAAPLSQSEVAKGPLELGRLDPGMCLQLAWDLFKSNIPLLLTTHLTFLVISILIQVVTDNLQDNGAAVAVLTIFGTAVNWFLTIGIIKVTLDVARGKSVEYMEMFSGGPLFVRVVIVNILYGLMVMFGLLLFIVPGIYLAMKFWPAQYFVIDRDMEVMDAFRAAGEFTNGNKGQSLLLSLLSAAVSIVGFLALCVGFIVAYPIITLMWSVGFMMITRQPIARPQA